MSSNGLFIKHTRKIASEVLSNDAEFVSYKNAVLKFTLDIECVFSDTFQGITFRRCGICPSAMSALSSCHIFNILILIYISFILNFPYSFLVYFWHSLHFIPINDWQGQKIPVKSFPLSLFNDSFKGHNCLRHHYMLRTGTWQTGSRWQLLSLLTIDDGCNGHTWTKCRIL